MSKVCFIGSGNMAEAIMGGIINSGLFTKEEILASDVNRERLSYINLKFSVKTTLNKPEDISPAEIIILSVKPQSLPEIGNLIHAISPDALIISILAGIKLEKIENLFLSVSSKKRRIMRTMPNLCALAGKAVTGICYNEEVSASDMKFVQEIFKSIGYVHICEESMMDTVTAVSGSGPAYFFYFLEAFIDAAKESGMNEEDAGAFCLETMEGAYHLLKKNQNSPKVLREKVTSKGGTTEAAIKWMEQNNFKAIFSGAVKAAKNRASELSV